MNISIGKEYKSLSGLSTGRNGKTFKIIGKKGTRWEIKWDGGHSSGFPETKSGTWIKHYCEEL